LTQQNAKQWCVIKGNTLYCYASKSELTPNAVINLQNTQVAHAGPTAFSLWSKDGAQGCKFHTDDDTTKLAWLEAVLVAQGVQHTTTNRENKGRKLGLDDFEVLKVIGRGSFGKVLKVRMKGTNQVYAMKALRKDMLVKEGMVQNALDEKKILQTVHHPFIVKLFWAFQTETRLYLVLEFLPGGELFFHLKTESTFSEGRSRQYAAEIACALHHLHCQGIVYRDLKPENIVLDMRGHACLTDMGLAKAHAEQQTYTFCGTPEYIAPEMLSGTGPNKAVDWWALGILLYEMLVGIPPFYSDNINQMYLFIQSKKLKFPADFPADAKDLISRLLTRDPSKRLSDGKKILAHKYFAAVDFRKLLSGQFTPEFVPDLQGEDDQYFEEEFTQQCVAPTVCRKPRGPSALFQNFTFQTEEEHLKWAVEEYLG
jgi:serine/threonine protein kinase